MSTIEEFSKKYFEILNTDLAGLNLTAIRDYDEFFNKQILDSILPFESSEVFQNSLKDCELVCDVGFGGGFPLVPLAHINSSRNFIGIEARKKKSEAVNLIALKLGVDNCETFHIRLEDIHFDIPTVLTFKAVGKVDKFLSMVTSSGPIEAYFYKALNFFDLEDDGLKNIEKDWDIIENREVSVPGTEKRILFGVKSRDSVKSKKSNTTKVTSLISK
jgi:16S rRNA (guanine527-N7)-methyltransferase